MPRHLPGPFSKLLASFGAVMMIGCGGGDDAGSTSGGGEGGSTSSQKPVGSGGTGGSAESNGSGGSSGSGGAGGSAQGGGPNATRGGVPLPSGWSLQDSDRFGTKAGQNVGTFADLHAKYYEAQIYNRDDNGLVRIPNVVINGEQETYVHFEDTIVFGSDHLTIQARGHADESISSGEMVSIRSARSFCVEGRYQIPSADKSWPAFWLYGDAEGHDSSEIDVEQPVYAKSDQGSMQTAHQVSLYNHPDATMLTILDDKFTSTWMTWTNPAFDASTAPHVYTECYDDAASTLTRYIDAKAIYSAVWKWNASLGGTGHGPDASVIFNLAVGGGWPGNVANPAGFSADLDLYSIEYYGP